MFKLFGVFLCFAILFGLEVRVEACRIQICGVIPVPASARERKVHV